jgi:hypothetical protein
MNQQHPDGHPGPCAGPLPEHLPGLRDPRPGRLREALAARAEAKSSLRARRAERLARIRDGMAALSAERGRAGLPAPPATPPRRITPGADLRAEVAAPPDVLAAPPVPDVPDEIAATEPPAIAAPSPGAAAGSPRLGDAVVQPALPQETVASPLRGAAPIPRETAAAPPCEEVAPPAGRMAAEADDPERDIEELERFLAGLVGALEADPVPQPARVAPTVVVLERTERETGQGRTVGVDDGGGLTRLPGAGPGLVAALARAGVPDLAALARLDPETLAARLGPIGRLIDLETWIAIARAETAGPAAASAG